MSTKTLPRGRMSGYCWVEHPHTHVHCTEPYAHRGQHWHPYSKTSWT
ncbi:hypothetical protein ACH40E_26335 [Streptomyces acidicola]